MYPQLVRGFYEKMNLKDLYERRISTIIDGQEIVITLAWIDQHLNLSLIKPTLPDTPSMYPTLTLMELSDEDSIADISIADITTELIQRPCSYIQMYQVPEPLWFLDHLLF